ncbi:MAG: ferrous iron transporter B [Clostridia bacterium]
MKKFALAGNPNSGKTTLFNTLTGSTAHVGNWPGVTVDKKEGVYKKCEEPISIIDLPGIYSLSPYTPEEVVSRNFILDEKPDCVINIIDATNLERNLYLTTQLMEMDVPVIIALNMMDAVEKLGTIIDAKKLEEKIGLPVVGISALKGQGIDILMQRAYETSLIKREGKTVLENSAIKHLIVDVKIALKGQNVENPLFHAVKLIELDEIECDMHKNSIKMVDDFKEVFNDKIFGNDFEGLIADSRYKYITKNYSIAIKKSENANKGKLSHSDKVDMVLTHRIWGIPIFLFIMFLIFHLTFSENLLFLGGAFSKSWTSFPNTAFEGVFGTGGINSPGVILANVFGVIFDSIIGAVSSLLVNAPTWVSGLVCNGMLGGLFAVLGFLPQILLLFLFFTILEDSGYMARIVFILDRIFRKFGLSGRAFLPMIMGFGCSVPAIINTRTLADEKEKLATIRVIPFFSCGAKLPILTAIAGGIVMRFGVGNADIITYSMYLLGIVTAIVSIIFMRSTTLKGEVPPFIMELPRYHAPQFKGLMIHIWDKAKHFIKKAFTIILLSTVVIWFVSHFTWNWQYIENAQINQSILASLGQFITPLFTPLGFGSQLTEWGWVFVVAAFTGLIAKENVIATFSTLSACITAGLAVGEEGVSAVVTMINATGATIPALIAFIAFNMTTIPCVAAVATAKAEIANKKNFNHTLVFWIGTSYILGTIIYLVGTWWWTAFIFIGISAIIITLIILNNKGKIKLHFRKKKTVVTKSSKGCKKCPYCPKNKGEDKKTA